MNSKTRKPARVLTGIVLLAVGMGVGMAVGWWWGQRAPATAPASMSAGSSPDEERAVLYWYDPMLPQHHFDQPGKSPFMDMDLVPKYASTDAAGQQEDFSLQINPQITQNLGLRTAAVARIPLETVVEATGVLAFNEREVAIEQTRSAGLVERVWPLAPGDVIAAGQPLAELLIPEWTAVQAEFLALRGDTDSALRAGIRERMRLLGMPASALAELEQTGRARQSFILGSSRSGVLNTLEVRSGMALSAGQTLAQIQGIDTLWLEVAVPEHRASAVHLGNDAEVVLAAFPGRTFAGRIIAVLPELATGSRTLRMRIELPNPNGQLRAGMSAQVRLAAGSGDTALAVPTEAVIRTGQRTMVMVTLGEGRFEPVAIALGPEIGQLTVVTDGLAEGQMVVASGQFLLDSEASLTGGYESEPQAAPKAAEDSPHAHKTTGEQL